MICRGSKERNGAVPISPTFQSRFLINLLAERSKQPSKITVKAEFSFIAESTPASTATDQPARQINNQEAEDQQYQQIAKSHRETIAALWHARRVNESIVSKEASGEASKIQTG
jgi:hypothetical protein